MTTYNLGSQLLVLFYSGISYMPYISWETGIIHNEVLLNVTETLYNVVTVNVKLVVALITACFVKAVKNGSISNAQEFQRDSS